MLQASMLNQTYTNHEENSGDKIRQWRLIVQKMGFIFTKKQKGFIIKTIASVNDPISSNNRINFHLD